MLRYDVEPTHPVEAEVPGEGDPFAVFSLVHAACGDDVLEVRIGERMLLEWCSGCAVMEVWSRRDASGVTSRTPAFQHGPLAACQLVFAEALRS